MTEDEANYQRKIAKLGYAVSPKTKLDWMLYLKRIEAINARRPASIRIVHGGIETVYKDVKEEMPCR